MGADYLLQLCGSLAGGLKYTVSLFFITVLFSIPIGLLLSFTRVGRSRVLKGIVGAFVWIMRGTPLLLQLYFFCYGITFLPGIGEYLVMDRFQAAVLAFILNYAAYFCEIFRGGILSVDKGQYEAAKVLGYSKWQTTMKIVIPQMLKVCLPPVSNECITLVKDTSLAFVIGYAELFTLVKRIASREANVLPYVGAAIFYYIFNLVVAVAMEKLEKKMNYYN